MSAAQSSRTVLPPALIRVASAAGNSVNPCPKDQGIATDTTGTGSEDPSKALRYLRHRQPSGPPPAFPKNPIVRVLLALIEDPVEPDPNPAFDPVPITLQSTRSTTSDLHAYALFGNG